MMMAKAKKMCLKKKTDPQVLTRTEWRERTIEIFKGFMVLSAAGVVDESEIGSVIERYKELASRLPKDLRDDSILRELGSDISAEIERFGAESDIDVPAPLSEDSLWDYGDDIEATWLSFPSSRLYELKEWEIMHEPIISFKEAPMLAGMVAARTLPPLSERLPQEPLVVRPFEGIGRYGGTLRLAHPQSTKISPGPWVSEYPVGHSPHTFDVYPNVLSAWKWSDDAKTVTMQLREGMRWSDGTDFTAADILFHWNHIVLNKELFPSTVPGVVVGGESGRMKKVSDTIVQISWDEPAVELIEVMAQGLFPDYAQMAFLMPFHPAYTDLHIIEASMREHGFETWADQFKMIYDPEQNAKAPVIGPWKLEEWDGTQVLTLVRNPYYWKVDTEGNQLPYIDYIQSNPVPHGVGELIGVLLGETDFQGMGQWRDLANVRTVREVVKQSGYRSIEYWRPKDQDLATALATGGFAERHGYAIVNINLGNIPNPILSDYGQEIPAQFYFKE